MMMMMRRRRTAWKRASMAVCRQGMRMREWMSSHLLMYTHKIMLLWCASAAHLNVLLSTMSHVVYSLLANMRVVCLNFSSRFFVLFNFFVCLSFKIGRVIRVNHEIHSVSESCSQLLLLVSQWRSIIKHLNIFHINFQPIRTCSIRFGDTIAFAFLNSINVCVLNLLIR